MEHNNELRSLFAVQNSPDLNPIMHLWDVLNKRSNLNLQDLKDLLLTSWRQIPQHTFRGLQYVRMGPTQNEAGGHKVMPDRCMF